MNTKKITTLLFGLMLALGLGLAHGAIGVWTNPTATPAGGSVELPITMGTVDQVKIGGLSVGGFSAYANAHLKQQSFFAGPILAQLAPSYPPTPPGTINFGESSTAKKVTTAITGNLLLMKSFPNTGTDPMGGQMGKIKLAAVAGQASAQLCANPQGYIVLCNPPQVDLCSNIAGTQATLGTGLTIDDPAQPTTCTQIIRATVPVGQYGVVVENASHNAMLANLYITGLNITSVGNTNTSTWPSSTPLKFRWGWCAKWNTTIYNGPYPTNPTPTGMCSGFTASYPYRSALPYSTSNGTATAAYLGYDGVTQVGNPFNGIPYPRGFFDAGYFESTGQKTEKPDGYNYPLWYNLNTSTDPYRNIVIPMTKLILYDVQVPAGYRLELTSPSTQSLEVHEI